MCVTHSVLSCFQRLIKEGKPAERSMLFITLQGRHKV